MFLTRQNTGVWTRIYGVSLSGDPPFQLRKRTINIKPSSVYCYSSKIYTIHFISTMDYDLISSMKVEELKYFLKLRGLKVSGRKVELVARVFAASENNVPLVKTAIEIEQDLKLEYQNKLLISDVAIPDPCKLESGWLSEENGRIFWPMVMYPDIFNYLMFYPSELGSTDLNDYKECKAYSYYRSGWLQELLYHSIDNQNPYCIIKSSCRKSEKINDAFHQLWVIIEKRTAKILRGHCSCMAGMGQMCNHVAAALFRMEATVRLGLTNPSCTSKPNEWFPCHKNVAPKKKIKISISVVKILHSMVRKEDHWWSLQKRFLIHL